MKISTVDDYNDGELASGGNEPDYQTASASWNAYRVNSHHYANRTSVIYAVNEISALLRVKM